jgi:SOS-response transcriptional repressor LexA
MGVSQSATEFGCAFELVAAHVEPGRRIPLLGTIAAGSPLPAFQVLESIDVPGGSWQRREVFALRVRGTSMIEDGILDGDYLVVEPKTDVRDGQTVVAEIDGHATVKRFYRERDGAVRLQPANDRLLPLVLRGERVRIRGVVVGVLRKQGFRAPAPSRPARCGGPQRGATDLAVRILEQHVAESRRIAGPAEGVEGRRGRELKSHAQSLRALHATYVETTHPRLRKALLDEATRVIRQMRAIAQRGR